MTPEQKEARLARQRQQSKEWYWKNREYARAKAAATYRRLQQDAAVAPKTTKHSIESIEQALPDLLKRSISRLRKNFLKIPILQRPPYDAYLKQLTIEYYKETSQ